VTLIHRFRFWFFRRLPYSSEQHDVFYQGQGYR